MTLTPRIHIPIPHLEFTFQFAPQKNQTKYSTEGEKEQDLYEKFMCYCKNGTADLEKQGADAAAEAADLNAKVEAQSSEKKQVDADLKQAKKDRADAKIDLDTATKLREKVRRNWMRPRSLRRNWIRSPGR
jgi:hypothetical protein